MAGLEYKTMIRILKLLAEYLESPYYEWMMDIIDIIEASRSYEERLMLFGEIEGFLEGLSFLPSKKRKSK